MNEGGYASFMLRSLRLCFPPDRGSINEAVLLLCLCSAPDHFVSASFLLPFRQGKHKRRWCSPSFTLPAPPLRFRSNASSFMLPSGQGNHKRSVASSFVYASHLTASVPLRYLFVCPCLADVRGPCRSTSFIPLYKIASP